MTLPYLTLAAPAVRQASVPCMRFSRDRRRFFFNRKSTRITLVDSFPSILAMTFEACCGDHVGVEHSTRANDKEIRAATFLAVHYC